MTPRVELKRVIGASRARVFAAWTDSKLMAKWLAPGVAEVVEAVADVRVGGTYRLRMKGEMLGNRYDVTVAGVYREVVSDEKLSFTWVYEDEPHRSAVGDSIVTVTLTSVAGGTEVTLVHEKIASSERRAGHMWGWTNCLEKLETLLGEDHAH